jgi:hypothetical protein
MLRGILIVIVAAVAVFLIVVARQPDSFRIARETVIKAPPEKIAPFIDDFHKWTAWSPYENRDPNLQRTYSGADHGKGARYGWVGNKDVGEGRMEILDESASKIAIDLEFLKPFAAHNLAEFTFDPGTDGTKVTWAMSGPQPFVAKAMHMFFDMDQMVGKDFADGLAKLKTVVEAEPAAPTQVEAVPPADAAPTPTPTKKDD